MVERLVLENTVHLSNILEGTHTVFQALLRLVRRIVYRRHRCCPFPPVRAFNFFVAHRVQHSPLLVDFDRMLLTHPLAFSAKDSF